VAAAHDVITVHQVVRFVHWLPEKAEYKCSFKGGSTGGSAGSSLVSCLQGFDAPASIVAPAAGPAAWRWSVWSALSPAPWGRQYERGWC